MADDESIPPEEQHPAAPTRPAWQSPKVMVLLAVVGTIVCVYLLFSWLSDRMPELTFQRYEAAREQWREVGPPSYDMDIRIGGLRPGVVKIEVRDGEVTAFERDGFTPEQKRLWKYWSVEGQFETIDRELEGAEDPEREMDFAAGTQIILRAAFDAKYGFPRGFQRVVLGGGTEVYWRVTRFEPR